MAYLHSGETGIFRIVASVRALWEGRSLAVGQFTCAPDADSTTVTAPHCAPGAQVFLQARTAASAAEVAAGGLYVSSVGQGQFVVAHANDPDETRTFGYAIRGKL
jgi:hypothetical protein